MNKSRVLNRRRSNRSRARKSGYLSRRRTVGGRRLLARQRRKKQNRR